MAQQGNMRESTSATWSNSGTAVPEAAENYLEAVLVVSKRLEEVRAADICRELGYSRPTVSVMMRKLRDDGYVRIDERGAITLTSAGLEVAELIYGRHRVLTDLLRSLGVSEKTACADACMLEHDLSEESFQALKRHFGM